MPEQTLYEFPRFVEHRIERKPTSRATTINRRATVSGHAKTQGEKSRKNVSELSRGLSQKKVTKAEPTVWLPGVPTAEGEFTPPESDAAAQLRRYSGPRAAEFLPSRMEAYLDMTPIRRGSFLYMSRKHVEKDDYFSFDQEHQTATF
ncbi:hypothetical protein F4820DRAFT_440662 [Hypoxylon rubiginosum]|uniref:Uncharacterized protein n=1 Tax=Hypoxylon rubiginosum TaxID=110542 RepID=A0ACB9YJX0_9PEZI|nr:hypothetical protein F4820DRAFT_440662 [Hypoxylon rubiginosum]